MTFKPVSLSAADCARVETKTAYPIISPSSNPCVVKLAGRRKMFNPYRGLTPKKALAQFVAVHHHLPHQQQVHHAASHQHQQQPQQFAQSLLVAPAPAAPAASSTAGYSAFQSAFATPFPQPSAAAASCVTYPASASPTESSKGSSFTAMMMEVEADRGDLPRGPHADSESQCATSFTHQMEESSLSVPPSMRFVVVEFKHELCTFQAHFRVTEGDYVVVEADRGEHVGRVRKVLDAAPSFHVPSRILRRALQSEVAVLDSFRQRETAAATRIQEMSDELGLALRIVDTEFYADGKKMTVFFASKATVDFRQLQRNLFREFHCRIWLINFAEVQYRNRNFRNRK